MCLEEVGNGGRFVIGFTAEAQKTQRFSGRGRGSASAARLWSSSDKRT